MNKIQVHDKCFVPYLCYEEIQHDIDVVADKINADYEGKGIVPIIVTVLNGAMMFTSELFKRLRFDCEMMSVKVKSYVGTGSTGNVTMPMGLTGSVKDRSVIVVEDIVDTGNTIVFLKDLLDAQGASDVKICTMLMKPDVYKKDVKINYVGRCIPPDFIVGFGLDYDELGRNYKDIYVLDK
mgnify:CR=1 FL=1